MSNMHKRETKKKKVPDKDLIWVIEATKKLNLNKKKRKDKTKEH